MKIYIICCVPAQISYLGKFLFLRYRPKCSQLIRLQDFWISFFSRTNWWIFWVSMIRNGCGQSGVWTLNLTVSEQWPDGIKWFFACWYKCMQIKRCLKMFEVGMVKNGCGQSGDRTLKLTIWKMNNWLFACWYRFTKIKSWSKIFWVGMVKNGCCQSSRGTLKLTVFQKWTDRINWFFAWWYKFRKTKSWLNDFWVDVVKNGHGVLVHKTLQSAVSYEWIYELSWFFECWSWCNNFWLDWYPLFDF